MRNLVVLGQYTYIDILILTYILIQYILNNNILMKGLIYSQKVKVKRRTRTECTEMISKMKKEQFSLTSSVVQVAKFLIFSRDANVLWGEY